MELAREAVVRPRHQKRQLDLVKRIVARGGWWTLEGIQRELESRGHFHISTQTISARLRDLRKVQYGAHTIDRRVHHRDWETPIETVIYEYRFKRNTSKAAA